MHTYTPASSIFDSLITNLLSILCILTEILSGTHAKSGGGGGGGIGGGGGLNDFKFGISIGRFPSDGAACVAVKGLN